jgi:peptidyl-prolyl cis-trans isomerase C
MLKHSSFLIAGLFAAGMAAPAWADAAVSTETGVSADTVVATVNGTDITVGQMIATREVLPQQYQDLPDEVLFEGVLDQLIQQTVLSQSLEGGPSLRTKLALENELRTLRAGEALDALIGAALTEEAINAAYQETYANAEPETEYNAAHILVKTREEADALRKQLDDGAAFADLAKEKSTGPSGANGGLLGWFTKGMMVKEFEDAVVGMEVNQISDPVETQFGWHLIVLNETRLIEAPKLNAVREEIVAGLKQKAIADAIKTLSEKAEVVRAEEGTIPTSVLSDVSLISK